MCLGDAHVEGAIGELLHHIGHGTTRGHGRCDTYDLIVLAGHLDKCMAEDILIELRLIFFILDDTLTGIFVEKTGCMPLSG